MTYVPNAGQMETASGLYIDLLDPGAEAIDPEDIARHLSKLCRYTGAVARFYSVAEHAVLVRDLLKWGGASSEIVRAGLLHDAAEAYLGDVSSPLKWVLRYVEHDAGYADTPLERFRGAYGQITRNLDRAIGERFDIDPLLFEHESVKTADIWALGIEARALLPSAGEGWSLFDRLPHGRDLPPGVEWEGGLPPDRARSVFAHRLRVEGVG